jgi:signal transduction histidine kinase/FixJ family two-component response regulator
MLFTAEWRFKMISKEYKIANYAGRFGVMVYGILRYLEGIITKTDAEYGFRVVLMSAIATLVLLIIQNIMGTNRNVPLVTGIFIMLCFVTGATFLRNFDYYFISMLCIVGIVCIYLDFRSVVLFFIASLICNIPMYFTLFRDPEIADMRHMTIDGILYLYGFLFLLILTYRLSVRNDAAVNGRNAFASLLKSTPNMTLIIDDMKKVMYISEKMAEFSDCPQQFAVGRPLIDLFRDFELKLMFARIISNEDYYEDIIPFDIDNSRHYFKIVYDKLQSGKGGMFIDVSDVTATVEAKLEAEAEKENAVSANNSKSKFLATMSHEIRTPMNAIIGIAQIQLAREDLPPDLREANLKIYSSGHILLGIINDILDLSKIETGKLELLPVEYDVPSLINDTVQLNINRIGSKPIEFKLRVSADVPAKLRGDELRLKQILNNILSNAFKYTDEGYVSMDVSYSKTPRGGKLIVSVSDTGQGMKPEDAKVLGNEFARFNLESNRKTEGTGLGMSITKRLVNLMNGTFEIQSVYGEGSTFTVSVMQEEVGSRTIGIQLAEKLRNFTFSTDKQAEKLQIVREFMPYGKVLVVDDVETNLYVAEGLLKPYGLTIETAQSGFETLDLIKEGNTYDIVFMDHMMPEMDGIETTEKLRASGYTAPIVALTANALAGNDILFKSKGFDEFISKPIDIRQLNAILNRYVRNPNKDKAEATTQSAQFKNDEPTISPKLAEAFVRDVTKAVAVFSELDKPDIKLFTTTAHAMKSACLNVGNEELSELAKKLEAAGKENNLKFIRKNAPDFSEKLQAFAETMKPGKTAAANKTPESLDVLRRAFTAIAAACDEYDENAAEKIVNALGSYEFDDSINKVISEISAHLLHAEFEEAAEKARASVLSSNPV